MGPSGAWYGLIRLTLRFDSPLFKPSLDTSVGLMMPQTDVQLRLHTAAQSTTGALITDKFDKCGPKCEATPLLAAVKGTHPADRKEASGQGERGRNWASVFYKRFGISLIQLCD